MPATNEREENPFDLLVDDQRKVDELLSRMAQVLDKVAHKRRGFESVDGSGQRFLAEPGPRAAPRN